MRVLSRYRVAGPGHAAIPMDSTGASTAAHGCNDPLPVGSGAQPMPHALQVSLNRFATGSHFQRLSRCWVSQTDRPARASAAFSARWSYSHQRVRWYRAHADWPPVYPRISGKVLLACLPSALRLWFASRLQHCRHLLQGAAQAMVIMMVSDGVTTASTGALVLSAFAS